MSALSPHVVLGSLASGCLVIATSWWAVSLVSVGEAPEASYAQPSVAAGVIEPEIPEPSQPRTDPLAKSAEASPYRPDPTWLSQVSQATEIPERALAAYASAQIRLAAEQPTCRVGWNTLAGIGAVESGHGSFGGAVLLEDGTTDRDIVGPALNGQGFRAISDTDGGRYDGDAVWDRAVGPMQFIPQTWQQWAADGNGDGVAHPGQIDDAVLAAARYLCVSGDLARAEVWRRAIFSFNHSDEYVAAVATRATAYAERAGR